MSEYQITLISPEGEKQTINCDDGEFILDAAERQGMDVPYSCRSGACTTCCCKMVSGKVDQSQQSILDDDDMGEGYVLICSAIPLADCTMHTHKEGEV